MLRFALALGCAVSFASPALAQSTIGGTFTLSLHQQFSYVNGAYEPLTIPAVQTIDFLTPLTVSSMSDYGLSTETMFGSIGQTGFNSSMFAYAHPLGLGGVPGYPYTFMTTSDYDSAYVTTFGINFAQYASVGNESHTLVSQVRIVKVEASRGGTGTADRAFSVDDLLGYLAAYQVNPNAYTTSASFYWTDYTANPGGGVTYSSGKLWDAYGSDVRLSLTSPVPEPATWAMLMVGFGAMGAALRSRKRATVSVRLT